MVVNEKKRRVKHTLTGLLGEPDEAKKRPSRAARRQIAPRVTVSSGNVYFGNVYGGVANVCPAEPGARPENRCLLSTPDKQRLLELRDQIVGVSRVLDGQQVTPATVMRKLERHMEVKSYADIPADRFAQAETYLVNWRARLEGMPGAVRSPGTRQRRICAIYALCDEMKCDRWRLDYMQQRWDAESMADLTNDEVEQLFRAIWNRKKSMDGRR